MEVTTKRWEGDKDYPQVRGFPWQEGENNRHFDKVCGGKGARHVPPMNSKVNSKLFAEMKMDLLPFLRVWTTNKDLKKVLAAEVLFEAKHVKEVEEVEKKDADLELKHPNFTKNMKWQSWSALLTLQYAFNEETGCSGFLQSLYNAILSELASIFPTKKAKANGIKFVQALMPLLHDLQNIMWPPDVVLMIKSSANSFPGSIYRTIFESPWWKKFMQDDNANNRVKYLKGSKLQEIKVAKSAKKARSMELQSKSLNKPQKVKEIDFVVGVARLMREVYGPRMAIHEPVELKDNDTCASALCLVQLMCGSRSRGVIAVNWFDSIVHTLDAEYRKEQGILSDQGISDLYNGVDHCVYVKRLTKEKEKDIQLYLDRSALARADGKNIEDINPKDVQTEEDRGIVKPILFMLLDSRYLDRSIDPGSAVLPPETGIEVFLRLITAAREYIYNNSKNKAIFVQQPDIAGKSLTHMWGLDNDHLRSPAANALVQKWNKLMSEKVREVFASFVLTGQGTHLLRRLYVNRGYYHFSADTLKETAFVRLTLGHKSYGVSLYYTSLLFQQAISPDDPGIAAAVLGKISALEAKNVLLEEALASMDGKITTLHDYKAPAMMDVDDGKDDAYAGSSFVTMVQRDGQSALILKLPRNRGVRVDAAGDLVQRHIIIAGIARLTYHGVNPTARNLFQLGVYTSARNRKMIKSILRELKDADELAEVLDFAG